MTPWTVRRLSGTAEELHGRPNPEPFANEVWINQISAPTLALGSAQPAELVDRAAAEAAGVEVCRRRSGGGVVELRPGAAAWVDVLLARTDERWHDDIGRSFHWLGHRWAAALAATMTSPVTAAGPAIEVHDGPAVRPEAGRVVCFAGLGHGEVTVDGRKVVGMSQRRTRSGARFQCAVVIDHRSPLIAAHVPAAALADVSIDIDRMRVGLPPAQRPSSPDAVVDVFVTALTAQAASSVATK